VTPVSSPWSGTFLSSERATLEAVPGQHRVLGGWSGDLSGSESPTAVLMDGDKSIVATFTPEITFDDLTEGHWAIGPINERIDATS